MKENLVSLAKLLATDDTFNLAFSSQGTNEGKYKLVKTKFTDLTREDFSEFLEKLCEAKKNSLASCSPDELEMVTGGIRGWVTKTAAMTVIATALGATGVMSLQANAVKPGSHARTSAPKGTKRSSAAAANSTHNGQTPPTDAAATNSNPKRRASQPAAAAVNSPEPKKQAPQPAAAAAGTPFQAQKQWRDTSVIRLGKPRSNKVILKFDHGDKSALEVLQAHRDNNIACGSSSLIGELAQIVQSYLVERRKQIIEAAKKAEIEAASKAKIEAAIKAEIEAASKAKIEAAIKAEIEAAIKAAIKARPPLNLCDITFKFGRNNDIVAHQCGAYNKIIEKMILSTSATPTSRPASLQAAEILAAPEPEVSEAAKILESLKYPEAAAESAPEHEVEEAAKILESLKHPEAAAESAPKSTASEPEKELPRREFDFPKAAEILVALAHSKLEPPIPASEPDPKKLAEEKHQSKSTASEPAEELSTPEHEVEEAAKILENLKYPEAAEESAPKSTASEPAEELSTPEPEVEEAAEMSARSKSHLQEEAEKILKNLSKPCEIPDGIQAKQNRYGECNFKSADLTLKHIETLACELFKGLDNGSKDLVAVFLCACIRFNDDGALVRWSIRKFIQNCEQGSPRKEIRIMYGPGSPTHPQSNAPFAPKGGTSVTRDLLDGTPHSTRRGASNKFEQNKITLENSIQCLSPVTTRLSDPRP